MIWLFTLCILTTFAHVFNAVACTLLLFQARKFHNYAKVLDAILVWLLPFYWAHKVRKAIEKTQKTELYYSVDLPHDLFDGL